MSTVLVEVCEIDAVKPHPNADRLDLIEIKGWQVVTQKGQFAIGDRVLYVPPNMQVPAALAEQWGIAKYLGKNGRVKSIRLRGEPSHGVAIVPDSKWRLGENLAGTLGIKKYVPPVDNSTGRKPFSQSTLPEIPEMPKYTDIEHLKHYRGVFEDGEMVYVSEKIHGSAWRMSCVGTELFYGSRNLRRKWPLTTVRVPYNTKFRLVNKVLNALGFRKKVDVIDAEKCAKDHFALGYAVPQIKLFFDDVINGSIQSVITQFAWDRGWDNERVPNMNGVVGLYGEVWGKSIQTLNYGSNSVQIAIYDIRLNNKYLDYDQFRLICDCYNLPTVPEEYVGPYSWDKIKELANLPYSTLARANGTEQIREGIVVKPVRDRTHPRCGRVAMKVISDDYSIGQTADNSVISDADADL